MPKSLFRWLAMAISSCLLTTLLIACGGGGGGDEPSSLPAVAVQPVAVPAVSNADTAQFNDGANEQRVLMASATPIAGLDTQPGLAPVTNPAPAVVEPVVPEPPVAPTVVAVAPSAPALSDSNQAIGGRTLPVLDWMTTAPALAALPPKAISDRFRTEDLKVSASATHVYPSSMVGLQCQGTNDTLFKVPAVSMAAGKTQADTLQRFGQAANVDGEQALRFAVDVRDTLPVDWPPRCELLAYPTAASSLPVGEPFWFAVSLWLDDLSGTQDEQIVAQWHQNDPRLNLNPFMALVQKGNALRVELRQSADALATKGSTSLIVPATLTIKPKQWMHLVIKAQIAHQSGAQHYFQLWQDGSQQINYTGPLGYNLASGSYAYAKVGVYKWLNGNTWDTSVPTRQVMLRSMLIARDPLNRYTVDGFATALSTQ